MEEKRFLFCRGQEKREGVLFKCPHVEFCKRYSKRTESTYHKYGKSVPVDDKCSCRVFVKKEVLVPEKPAKIKKTRTAQPKKATGKKRGRPRRR